MSDGCEALLELRNVRKEFGGVVAVSDVSFRITREHSFWGLIGPNGSGKTTLFNIISGVYQPSAGEVLRPVALRRALVERVLATAQLYGLVSW